MNRRTIGPRWPMLALALALRLAAAGPAPAAAQSPAPAASAPSRPAPPVSPDALPSTVSPAIERFMRAGGRSLVPLPEPEAQVAQTPGTRGAAMPPTPTGVRPPTTPAPTTSPTTTPTPTQPIARPTIPAGRSSETQQKLTLKLKAAPLEPSDLRFPINLATALRLSDARPLIVAAAQAGTWVAEAELTRAKLLWVPVANVGFNYIRHDGGGPDFNKGIMTAPSVNYFMGGAGADIFINLTDAYFQPLLARQVLDSRHWDVQTAKNDALLQTADSYFRVHQHRGMYTGALYTVERGRDLVERIAQLSRELVPQVEVDRARNILADLEQRAVSARENWRVSSADLTQVLRLDPRAVVVPLEHDHVQVTLIDPMRTFDDMMAVALTNRPELASRSALVNAAEIAVRREKARPFVPIVLINGFQHASMFLQGGIFALGPNSSLNQWRGRNDLSAQLVWQVEGFGFGNLARIKQQRGRQSEAIVELMHQQDAVAAEVNRALARVQSAAARVTQADRALRTGIITFNGHLEGLSQTRRLENVLVLTFRPQEAVYSLDLLSVAFNEYFTTVAEYNRAQFELFHAIGYPASEVGRLRLPGAEQPVDTRRPAYLPPVGNGPPPATR